MNNATVLVVDDDPEIVDLLEVALSEQGYQVLAAVDKAALRVAQERHPDVILLDILMPGLDGVEISRRLRADPTTADIPIIAMSAHDRLRTTGRQMAVDDRLPKPFELHTLYELVARWGGGHRPAHVTGERSISEEGYQALLYQLAALRQENERLRQQLAEAEAGERSTVGSSLLHYVLEVLCALLQPQRAHTIASSLPDAPGGAPQLGIGPLQRTLERSAVDSAWQGHAVRLTTRYESVLWLPIRQGSSVAVVLCLRRGPTEPFTSTEQILGEALAPLLISALQTGYRCFDLTEDPHALATLGATLSASVRTGGGRVAARARDAEQLAYRFQLGAAERATVRLAAILHDIGTVDLAEDLMHREGRLSAAELAQVREHPHFGAAIVQQLPGLEAVAPLVLHHHERWDGTGYPHGLKAGAIPLGARIVAVVDAFHAMTSPRNNRLPRTPAAALAELEACAGSQFDRRVVEEFVRLAGESEAGGA